MDDDAEPTTTSDSGWWRDPLASIQPDRETHLYLTIDGTPTTLVVDPPTAGDWVPRLHRSPPDPVGILFDAIPADQVGPLRRAALRGTIPVDQLTALGHELITQVSGRRWWVTCAMIKQILADWELLGGGLALAGLDGFTPLAAWMDAAWELLRRSYTTSEQGAKDLRRLEIDLRIPPVTPGTDETDPGISLEQFQQAMMAL